MLKIVDFIGAAFIILGAGAAILAFVLGIYWLLWSLWCFVIPQLWVSGPENFTHPSFWLFAAAWVLFVIVGKSIFSRAKT